MAKTQRIKINNELAEFIKRQQIILVRSEVPTKREINVSLTSVQDCLDELVRQFNKLSQGPEDITLTYDRDPDGTLFVNISGTAKKAVEDEDGNNIKRTYFKNSDMTVDKSSGTLYIK